MFSAGTILNGNFGGFQSVIRVPGEVSLLNSQQQSVIREPGEVSLLYSQQQSSNRSLSSKAATGSSTANQ
jgi:hypothetical protein